MDYGFPPPVNGQPAKGVSENQWKDECAARRLSASTEKKAIAQAFNRVLGTLLEKKEIGTRMGLVWLTR